MRPRPEVANKLPKFDQENLKTMSTLIAETQSYITPAFLATVHNLTGEPVNVVEKGIHAGLLAIVSELARQSDNASLIGKVYNLIRRFADDRKSQAQKNEAEAGDQLVSLIFGETASDLRERLGSFAGIGADAVPSVIAHAAIPLIVVLSQKQLGSTELGDYLKSERKSLSSAAPADLQIHPVKSENGPTSSNLFESEAGSTRKTWIWVALAGIALLVFTTYFLTKSKDTNPPEHDDSTNVRPPAIANAPIHPDSSVGSDTLKFSEEEIALRSWALLGDFIKTKLPTGVELNIPEAGVEARTIAWLNQSENQIDKNLWFNFDRVLFEAGQSKLHPASQEQLRNLSEILKAYPLVKIRIGAYTDNDSDSKVNLRLSTDRAKAVVTQLTNLGTDPARLDPQGFGDKYPVGDNTTEEGRRLNRRTAFQITEK